VFFVENDTGYICPIVGTVFNGQLNDALFIVFDIRWVVLGFALMPSGDNTAV
jgi:hypothetical protein